MSVAALGGTAGAAYRRLSQDSWIHCMVCPGCLRRTSGLRSQIDEIESQSCSSEEVPRVFRTVATTSPTHFASSLATLLLQLEVERVVKPSMLRTDVTELIQQ